MRLHNQTRTRNRGLDLRLLKVSKITHYSICSVNTKTPGLTKDPAKLLRVRKDLPTTIPCAVSHAAWLRIIAPLFRPDQLVEQSLIELRPPGLVERLNAELAHWEKNVASINRFPRSIGSRPKCRQGVYLANDEHGLLITDMTRCKDFIK
jgi:hypothetical protein